MVRARSLLVVLGCAAVSSACAGSGVGQQGPVVSSVTPTSGTAPRIGSTAANGIAVSDLALHGPASAMSVNGTITASAADALVSVGSNYSNTVTLPRPLPLAPGAPTVLGSRTVTLRASGPIDPGATVAVVFAFRQAGTVQAFGTYSP
jgi:hypothetical protein